MTDSQHTAEPWIRAGLWGLPAYGLLTFASSLNPQPDNAVDYAAWARFVTTPEYLLGHVLGSGLGLVLAVFGVMALAAVLARSRATRMGMTGMVLTVFAHGTFLMLMALSAFAAPDTARAWLAGVRNIDELQASPLSGLVQGVMFGIVIIFSFAGNILLGAAVWRSGSLPRLAGALWILSSILLYAAGLVVGLFFTHDSPPTEPIGAIVVAIAGTMIAIGARRAPAVVLAPPREVDRVGRGAAL